MPIKIQHRGVIYTVETPEEAARLGALLKEPGVIDSIQATAEESEFAWTPEVFHEFMEHLGVPQRAALSALVERRRVSDSSLREVLGVSDNQALGGVLSGISKQAMALGIPARAVFRCENYRNAGKRRGVYLIDGQFHQIATAEKGHSDNS